MFCKLLQCIHEEDLDARDPLPFFTVLRELSGISIVGNSVALGQP